MYRCLGNTQTRNRTRVKRGVKWDGKSPFGRSFATFTRKVGPAFSMHVTRNLCDRQRETGESQAAKISEAAAPSQLRGLGIERDRRTEIVILDERELISAACQCLLRRASVTPFPDKCCKLPLSLSRNVRQHRMAREIQKDREILLMDSNGREVREAIERFRHRINIES